ncbi:WcaF family extracellular polysaccharide biosynthesis acetyltransferase [Solimonas soli]|uniref:WcaF family extracellular polysaccharide biosynthesis acetyltransferase n=1 Tax=Solimonas soli TaxID=413479 RepID=UPI00344E3951
MQFSVMSLASLSGYAPGVSLNAAYPRWACAYYLAFDNFSLIRMTQVRLSDFDASPFDRGAPLMLEAIWYITKRVFFLTSIPWPSKIKCSLLRLFGARIGSGCVIKPRVNIHMPWKLFVGDDVWIGEEVFLLNLDRISIGANCCISQRAFLCTGNHNYRIVTMPYRNEPILVEDGAWIGAATFIGPGVTVGREAVISAGSVLTQDASAGMVYAGNPCGIVKTRWKS